MTPTPPPPDSGRYLTIDELAARTGMPKSLLYRLKDDGRIPFVQRRRGGKLFFPPDAMERATIEPTSAGIASEPPASGAASRTPAASPKRLPGRRPKWDGGV